MLDLAPSAQRQTEIVERAMAFPLDKIVGRYAKEQGVPLDVAKEHERELRRYLALCAVNPGVPYGMYGAVDDLWHTFVLFTRDYSEFCEQVAGRFIHHVPTIEGTSGSSSDGYRRMLSDYAELFGEEPLPRSGRAVDSAHRRAVAVGPRGPGAAPALHPPAAPNRIETTVWYTFSMPHLA